MVSRTAARLAADPPAIATAHFLAEADPYHPGANPDGYVNLGTAQSWLVWDLLEPVLTAPRPVRPEDVHYGQLYGTESLRAAVAALLGRTWRTTVDPGDLVVVSGATAALDIAATVLCDPGEAVVVPAPYYSALDVDLVGRSSARLVPVPMAGTDGFALDPAALDRALDRLRCEGVAVRAIAVTSPSNPQGQVHSTATLRELLRVATVHDVDVIADEVYAHSVFGPDRFVSMLDPDVLGGVSEADPSRVHVVWGFAKVRRFLAESSKRLAASYRNAVEHLARHGIGHVPAHAGFSVWVDLCDCLPQPTYAAEHALWERVLGTAKVNILPGAVFRSPEPGWFRLCHAVDPTLVRHGVDRLAATAMPARRSA